jgi:hypothetical protein
VYGDLLEPAIDSLEVVDVAIVAELPAGEMTWLSLPRAAVGFATVTGLDKLPITRAWLPAAWPVWNHAIGRPVRIWGRSGSEEAVLAALTDGTDIEAHRLDDPSIDVYREQLLTELAASLTHLRRVTDGYWEPAWRAVHKGFGLYAQDHLWRAAQGYLELRDAIAELGRA